MVALESSTQLGYNNSEIGNPDLQTTRCIDVERRRPGRLSDISTSLIPLLRSEYTAEPAKEQEQTTPRAEHDALSSIRGLILGSCFGLLLWAMVSEFVLFLIRNI